HERWHEAVNAGREALEALVATGSDSHDGRGRVVKYAAETLVAGGRVLQNDETVLEGHRAGFGCERSDSSLAELLQAGEAVGRRESVLEQAIELLESDTEGRTRMHVKALLMAGRLGETFAIARSAKAVGWTHPDSTGGLCFAAILAHAAGRHADTLPTIERLLEEHAGPSQVFIDSQTDEKERHTRSYLVSSVMEGVAKAELDENIVASYLRWAETVGRARVDFIVSQKQRGAYRRAAEVLVALAELYAATGRPQLAADLIDEYRDRFNRHSAFKRELREALSQTDLRGISRG
ncbi:MAG: hypothetical protein ACOCXE_03700, partial [Spirochaetota bacterium]